jgi:outer membrane receptor protein involved in Fe transport
MRKIISGQSSRLLLTLLFCFLLLSSITALGQSTTAGAIGGAVSDQSHAMVASAKITVQNLGTHEQKIGMTDSFGNFRIIALIPGQYEVNVEAPGYASYRTSGVVVEIGRVAELKIGLALGASHETVLVTAEAQTVNTVQADFANNINSAAIENLPINGRKWSNFAILTPGLVPDGPYGLISFRGISGLLNMNTVDGGNNNDAFWSEERGRTRSAYTISQSSVQEFQVNNSNFSSEYGRAAGGVVNTVTKSGSDNLHGEAFYYLRDNSILSANNPFSTAYVDNSGVITSKVVKPEDRRQQFGGNLGGPIIKNKLFWFFNYDGQRRNFAGIAAPASGSLFATATTPTTVVNGKALGTKSDLSTIATGLGLCPVAPCNSAALSQAQSYYSAAQGFLLSETGTVARQGNQDIFFPKLDWVINSKNVFSASYNRMRWNSPNGVQTVPVYDDGIASWGNDYVKTDMALGRLTTTLTNNLTNEFRYQFGRDFQYEYPDSPSAPEVSNKLVPASGYLPQIAVASQLWIGTPTTFSRVAYPDEARNQFTDTMNWAHRHHLIKFGVDVDRANDLQSYLYNGFGSYSYTTLDSFAEDFSIYENQIPKAATNWSSFSQAFGPLGTEFHTWDYAGFIQDDWKVAPRLTVNLGVRYEFEQLPAMQYSNPAFPTLTQAQGTLLTSLKGVNPTNAMPSDKNNFGPRVGFAWDIFGDGKDALRGGYGMYYGRINNGAIGSVLLGSGVAGHSQTNYSIAYNAGCAPNFPAVFSTLPAGCASALPAISYFDPHLQNPQIHEVDLVLEHEIARNTVASVSYLGTFGREMMQWIDRNLPNVEPTTTAAYTFVGGPYAGLTKNVPFYAGNRIRPISTLGAMVDGSSSANSSYHAMVVQLKRRMTNGLQFDTSYTWSHSIDNSEDPSQTQTSTYGAVYDPNNLSLEKGSSNFDVRHRFVTALVWQPQYFRNSGKLTKAVLNGWGLAPVVIVSSGKPYTESISGNDYTCAASGATTKCTTNYGMASGINGAGGVYRLATLLPRNDFRYPTFSNVDLRLARKINLTERQKLEFVMEAFNLFNSEQVSNISTTMYSMQSTSAAAGQAVGSPAQLNYVNNVTGSAPFGSVSAAGTNLYRERQVQFALHYSF